MSATPPRNGLWMALVMVPLLTAHDAWSYPTDQGARTGIRRLDWQRDIDLGKRRGRKTPPGAQWPDARIKLRMTDAGKNFDLLRETPKDPALQAGLVRILKAERWSKYHVAVLDITDPAAPRYAAVDEEEEQTPGSVAKILVATALFDALARRFPTDISARERMLKTVEVQADEWAMPNSHQVPVIDGDKASIRAVKNGDRFTLWEWVDHALSPSSNAAGTMVWREATLLRLLGDAYPPRRYDAALWKKWGKTEFTAAAFDALDRPLRDAKLDPDKLKLRAFFTRGAGRYLKSSSSRASPLALLQWMVRVEQGRMVDAFSSLELKRLLYLTRRRVRYAEAPELKECGVFFKSGSLFKCKPEPGYQCVQYEGNVVNVLNGLIEVEAPPRAGADRPTVYLVAVMSNELKKNAAKDHGRLASQIHRLILGE